MRSHRSSILDEKIYRSICLAISERADQVEWDQLNSDDWDSVYQTANKERVAPLLYWSLTNSRSASSLNLPESFLNKLQTIFYTSWTHNTNLYRELGILLEKLVKEDIKVIVLKGASLAVSLYPDIGLRPMADLDLLVGKSQFSSAIQIAESIGYRDTIPDAGLDVKDLITYNVYLRQPENNKIPLELHTSLVGGEGYNYSVSMDWFWAQIEPCSWEIKGIQNRNEIIKIDGVYQFTASAQLIYMCAHAMLQHGLGKTQLIWLFDIHQRVVDHRRQIDWNLVVNQAKVFNWEYAVYSALTQAQSLFDTSIPSEVLKILQDSSDGSTRELVEMKAIPTKTRMMAEWRNLVAINWETRLRLVTALLFPSPNYMRWRYRPKRSWTLPYYYFFRWIDIFADGLKTIQDIIQYRTK